MNQNSCLVSLLHKFFRMSLFGVTVEKLCSFLAQAFSTNAYATFELKYAYAEQECSSTPNITSFMVNYLAMKWK